MKQQIIRASNMKACIPIERNQPATDKQTNNLSVEHFFSFWSRLDLFFFSSFTSCVMSNMNVRTSKIVSHWIGTHIKEHFLENAFYAVTYKREMIWISIWMYRFVSWQPESKTITFYCVKDNTDWYRISKIAAVSFFRNEKKIPSKNRT